MNKKFLLLCTALFLTILFFSGCKTEDPASYTLTVTLGGGVTGTPAAGTATYNENDTVSYNYSAQAGYGNLQVTLDGTPVANTGVVTMDSSHTLNATATIDIRDMWTGRFHFEGDDVYFEVTFSGGILSGTARGTFEYVGEYGNGTFTVSGNTVTFALNFYSGQALLDCEAVLTDVNHMNGDWWWTEPGWEGGDIFTLER